jgi:hypothetical protein
VTRHEPWKLPSALSSSRVSNRSQTPTVSVPAVGGEARDKRKRVTFADAVAAHVEPVAAVVAQLGVDGRAARGPAQQTRRSTARLLALGVTPAHRQFRLHAAQSNT